MNHPFTPPEREDDPRDDDQKAQADAEQLYDCAKRIAIAAARKSGDALAPGHEYLTGRFGDDWQPHDWVIDAVADALRIARGRP